jgi:hypothetical protein
MIGGEDGNGEGTRQPRREFVRSLFGKWLQWDWALGIVSGRVEVGHLFVTVASR